jgi:hypothetical protein
MYATATVNHGPLLNSYRRADDIVATDGDNVSVRLRELYLSLTPQEAQELGLALIRGAAQTEAAKAASEAPVPAQSFLTQDEDLTEDPRCRKCGHRLSWHSEDDGQCPDDDSPRPDSVAGIVIEDRP